MIDIYTDGACAGNPGPGGWGVLIIENGKRRELHGGDAATTNNRMEMMAAIEALRATQGAERVTLHTDSQYVRNGILDWMTKWKRNGWRTADGKPVKNKDLWEALDAERTGRKIDWRWVKGHAGEPNNERADELARLGCESFRGRTPKAG